MDIIKNGGYKISALEVERCLLLHSSVKEVAVLGLPDITWGQKIAAVIVLKPENSLSLSELKEWAKDVMPPQNIPTVLKVVPDLSRNAMGKINKKQLMAELFFRPSRTIGSISAGGIYFLSVNQKLHLRKLHSYSSYFVISG